MIVKIYDDLYGRFQWTLLDGPDDTDECSGSASSYDEACKQVALARAGIAQEYEDSSY